MSKSIKETFVTIINEGYKSTESITDPFQKASALANLGQALALSGLLSTSTQMAEPEESTATGKDSLKAEACKGKKTASKSKAKTTKKDEVPPVNEIPPVEEPEVETPPVEEDTTGEAIATTEGELSEEWTEEMSELKAEQLEMLGQYVEAWEASYVYGDCIPAFFEDGSIVANEDNYYEYIRPTNIDGFLAYLASLAE